MADIIIIGLCKEVHLLKMENFTENASVTIAPDDRTLYSMCKKTKAAEEIYAVPSFFCTS